MLTSYILNSRTFIYNKKAAINFTFICPLYRGRVNINRNRLPMLTSRRDSPPRMPYYLCLTTYILLPMSYYLCLTTYFHYLLLTVSAVFLPPFHVYIPLDFHRFTIKLLT